MRKGREELEEADKAREAHPSGRPSEGWLLGTEASGWLAHRMFIITGHVWGRRLKAGEEEVAKQSLSLHVFFPAPGPFLFVLRVGDSLRKWKQKKKFKKKLKQLLSSPPQAAISAAGVDRTSRYNLECFSNFSNLYRKLNF